MTEETRVQVSSGNVFADLVLENCESVTSPEISNIITKQNMTFP